MDSVDPLFQVVVVFPDLREQIMRIHLRGLTMTAVLLSASASYAVAQNTPSYVGDAESDYYGEADMPAEASAPYAEGTILQTSAAAYIGDEVEHSPSDVRSVAMQTTSPAPYHAAGLKKLHAVQSPMSGSCDSGCGGACDGGCSSRGRMSQMMCGKAPEVWMRAEALLWFPQARSTPPLVATAPAGELPFLGNPDARVVADEFGNNLSPGFRLDFGRYFGDGNFGIGGRFWMLAEDDDSFRFGGDGTNGSIGRPFFNSGLGVEDAVFIGFEDGGNDDFQGSVSGEASLQIIAAEAYGRLNLGRGREFHTDLIGGYSYFGIDDDLSIRSNSIDKEDGGETTFSDFFNTRNEFHGGQLGAETILRRGRWVARSVTKVHLGNMNQQVSIRGQATNTAVLGAPLETFDRGLLAGANQGVYERDEFTFAPELNLQLGYRFREHVTFTVGYSFLYWNNVALAGQQIDRNIDLDTTDLSVIGATPAFQFRDAGFWVQGIDLGATIEF
jgi:hypothetical protein